MFIQHEVTSTPAKPLARKGILVAGVALTGAIALSACGGVAEADPPAASTADRSPASAVTVPAAGHDQSPLAARPQEDLPMDDWKTADLWGFTFKYPAQWSVRLEPNDEGIPESEFSTYQLLDASGDPIALFMAQAVRDTDGNMGIYDYTDLRKIPAPNIGAGTKVLYEYMDVTYPDDVDFEPHHAIRLALRDSAWLARRGTSPSLPAFENGTDYMSWFSTEPAFFNKGLDPKTMTQAEARAFMKTERYRAMEQVLLSVQLPDS